MSDSLNVRSFIDLVLRGKGGDDAAKQLDHAKKSAEGTTRSFKSLESGTKSLGASLTRYIGIAATAAAAYKGFVAFGDVDRALSGTRIQMKGMGIDADKALPVVMEFLEGLRAGGSGLMADTLPAFRNYLALTKNVPAAMALVSLAASMGESDMGGFAEASMLLTGVLSGKPAKSLKAFGIQMQEAEDGTINAREGLEALTKAFPEAFQKITDSKNVIDTFAGGMEKLSQGIGFGVAAALGIETAPVIAGATGEQVGQALHDGIQRALDTAEMGDKAKQRVKDAEKAKDAAEAAKKIADADFQTRQQLLEDTAALEKEASARQVGIRVQALMEARDRAVQIAKDEKRDFIGVEMVYNNEIARVEKEGATRRNEITQESLDKAREYYEQMAASAREFSQEATAYFQEALDADQSLIREQLSSGRLALSRRRALSLKLLAIEERERLRVAKNEDAKQAIRDEYALKRIALEQDVADTQLDQQMMVAQAVVSLGTSIFGESKALAVAETIINSLAAAVAAFKGALQQGAPYYVAAILAASALAYGFAQVRQIEATEKGGGEAFDDRRNDEMAYRMGRKSIRDFVQLAGQGITEELRAARDGGAVAVVSAGGAGAAKREINFYAPVWGGDHGMREVRRKIERADRFDRSRRMK